MPATSSSTPPIARLRLARDDSGEPEIFRSFQGEGPMAGQQRTFIRFSGCNLHCQWCDTPYTWNWSGSPHPHKDEASFDPAREVLLRTVEEAAAAILGLGGPGVVITGGEPLMQPRQLEVLVQNLRAARQDLRIEIETNGTFPPSAVVQSTVDLFVVSPKLRHSGNDPAVLAEGVEHFRGVPNAVFKFVAKGSSDILEAAHACEGIDPGRLWIMPEGRTPDELDKSLRAISEATLERGWNLTDRQHIRLFGDTRGT